MMGKGIFALSAVVLALALQAEPASANDYGYPAKQDYGYPQYSENKYPEYPAKKEKEYEPAYKPSQSYPSTYKQDDYNPYPAPKKVEEKYPKPEVKYPPKESKPYQPAYQPPKEYNPYPEKKEVYPSYPEQKQYAKPDVKYPAKEYEPYPEKKEEYPSYPQPKQYPQPEVKYPAKEKKPYQPEYKPAKEYNPYPEKKVEYPSYPQQKQYPPQKNYEPEYNSYQPQKSYNQYPQPSYNQYPQPSYNQYPQPSYQPNYQQYYESESESEEYPDDYKTEDPYKCRTCERPKLKNKLVVIAVAGLRYDAYARNKDVMPTVTQFIYEGTESKHVVPPYPSEVVPCSRTLVTGAETQKHNLVGNFHVNVERYEKHTDSEYRVDDLLRTTSYPEDYTLPHIGILQEAKVAGYKVCSQGFLREDVDPYNITLDYAVPWPGDNDNDVNTAQDNAAIGATLVKDCDFTLIYINELLNRAEKYGPNSKQVRKFLRKLDNLLKKFLKDLECEGVNPKDVNIAIVGLNGVSDAKNIYKVNLEKYVSYENVYRIHGYGAYMGFFTYPHRTLVVYNRLKYVKGIKVYLKKDIPEEYKYRYSCNAPDILVVPDNYYYILPLYNPKAIPSINPYNFTVPKGYTGRYAGEYEEARSALVLVGPAFKKYHKIEAVRLVDLYNLFAYLLDVYPRKNDGKFSRIQDALVKYVPKNYNDYSYDDKYPPPPPPKKEEYPAPSYKPAPAPAPKKENKYPPAPAYKPTPKEEKPYPPTYVKEDKYPAPKPAKKEPEYKAPKVEYPEPKPAYPPPKESYEKVKDYPRPAYKPQESYAPAPYQEKQPEKKAEYPSSGY